MNFHPDYYIFFYRISTQAHFEHLANEILYEIFEYLDLYSLYDGFSKLNQRFYNLIFHSQFPIDVNIASISKGNFQHFYTDVLQPNIHRIKSLCISNFFTADILLSTPSHVAKYLQLETLILDNLPKGYLNNLRYLNVLPRLFSLVVLSHNDINDQTKIYDQIFQLPVLKYCQVSLQQDYLVTSSSFVFNRYSPIKQLVIKNSINLNLLYNILSSLPQLRRLSVDILLDSTETKDPKSSIDLNHLTHVSFESCSITFGSFAILAEKYFSNLQVLCISTSDCASYLNAEQWECLITFYIPKLKIFDFQHTFSIESDQDFKENYENFIDEFTSSFWIERQWFFSIQRSDEQYPCTSILYSTKTYR